DAEGLVQRPIVRVDALESEARRGREAVIVDLLELGLPDLLAVVLVRRVARPVASGCQHLDDQESLGRRARRQYVANVAGVGARAPHLIADILRADQPRRYPPFGRRGAHRELAVGLRCDSQPRPRWRVDRERLAIERTAPSANRGLRDRKSTRLNSSHVAISYAVLCLKKNNRPDRAPCVAE